jgi:hypothetical protein
MRIVIPDTRLKKLLRTLLELVRNDSSFGDVLDTIGIGIGALELDVKAQIKLTLNKRERIEDDIVYESTMEAMNKFIGVSFVLCQTKISEVHSRINKLYLRRGVTVKKKDILDLGDRIKGNESFTKIELINELSNYFKHSEEWTAKSETKKHSKQATYTMLLLQSCGIDLKQGGSVLRSGLKILEINNPARVTKLQVVLDKWIWTVPLGLDSGELIC